MTLILPFHYSLHLWAQTNYSEPVFGRKQKLLTLGWSNLFIASTRLALYWSRNRLPWRREQNPDETGFPSLMILMEISTGLITRVYSTLRKEKLHFSIQMSCWGRRKGTVVSGIAIEAKPNHQHAMGPDSHTPGHRLLLTGRSLSFCLEESSGWDEVLPAIVSVDPGPQHTEGAMDQPPKIHRQSISGADGF